MTKETGGFDALLEELGETLAKADTSGQAVAAAAAAAAEDGDGDKGDPEDGDKGDNEDGEVLGKSFELTLESGEKLTAVDGGELIKSIMNRVEKNEGSVLSILGKAVGLISSQGELIKSLQDQVGALSSQGKGRKTVVTIAERPAAAAEALAKSHQEEGLTGQEFMAKAMTAWTGGKLTGQQLARAEQYVNQGQQPPEEILRAVLA